MSSSSTQIGVKEDLSVTAVKTIKVGNIKIKSVKALENVIVSCDYAVRENQGMII